MNRLVLVVGGVRSGKSRFAQELAQQLGGHDVLFVATAEAGDDEMVRRIEHHRRTRPDAWATLERPLGTGQAIRDLPSLPAVILIDCLTLLVSNALMQCDGDTEAAERRVTTETEALITAAREQSVATIIVSGEVGQGLVPATPLGRAFRDLLGRANQTLAAEADAVYSMVAGLAIDVKSLADSPADSARRLATRESGKS